MQLSNPNIRYLNDMKEVLYDQGWAASAPNLELYYMYRRLKHKKGLRYDITVIPFQMLGKEFTKTKGHEHPDEFAELYEVLEGQALFLLQKRDKNSPGDIEDVYIVAAKENDKVFIPAHYGHITINPGPENLKMANWVADDFKSDYTLFITQQGACYYAVKENGELKWIKNINYSEVPEIRFEKPNQGIPKDLKKALLGKV